MFPEVCNLVLLTIYPEASATEVEELLLQPSERVRVGMNYVITRRT
jgi:hypothetical protein